MIYYYCECAFSKMRMQVNIRSNERSVESMFRIDFKLKGVGREMMIRNFHLDTVN